MSWVLIGPPRYVKGRATLFMPGMRYLRGAELTNSGQTFPRRLPRSTSPIGDYAIRGKKVIKGVTDYLFSGTVMSVESVISSTLSLL